MAVVGINVPDGALPPELPKHLAPPPPAPPVDVEQGEVTLTGVDPGDTLELYTAAGGRVLGVIEGCNELAFTLVGFPVAMRWDFFQSATVLAKGAPPVPPGVDTTTGEVPEPEPLPTDPFTAIRARLANEEGGTDELELVLMGTRWIAADGTEFMLAPELILDWQIIAAPEAATIERFLTAMAARVTAQVAAQPGFFTQAGFHDFLRLVEVTAHDDFAVEVTFS